MQWNNQVFVCLFDKTKQITWVIWNLEDQEIQEKWKKLEITKHPRPGKKKIHKFHKMFDIFKNILQI